MKTFIVENNASTPVAIALSDAVVITKNGLPVSLVDNSNNCDMLLPNNTVAYTVNNGCEIICYGNNSDTGYPFTIDGLTTDCNIRINDAVVEPYGPSFVVN